MFTNRYNSTIKQKIGLCVDCHHEVEQPLVAGRCFYHNKKYRYEQNKSKAKTKNIKTLGEAFGTTSPQSELIFWYADGMKNCEPICENCGGKINKYNNEEWHGSQGHILPKAHFESVKSHPMNRIILCRYGNFCHGAFDSNWLRASQMPCFKIAKERFKKFEHLIAPEERRRIPDCFLD